MVGLLLVAVTPSDAPADDSTALADKILRFCKDHWGQKGSNGQCGAFVGAALKASGAKTAMDYKASHKPFKCPFCGKIHKGGGGEYVWGKEVYKIESTANGLKETGKLAKVRPGDIVQYRHARFPTQGYGHHSAIIAKVTPEEKKIHVYHQLGKVVGGEDKPALNLGNLKDGWIRIYRPQLKKGPRPGQKAKGKSPEKEP
jgi:hypothetical protein